MAAMVPYMDVASNAQPVLTMISVVYVRAKESTLITICMSLMNLVHAAADSSLAGADLVEGLLGLVGLLTLDLLGECLSFGVTLEVVTVVDHSRDLEGVRDNLRRYVNWSPH